MVEIFSNKSFVVLKEDFSSFKRENIGRIKVLNTESVASFKNTIHHSARFNSTAPRESHTRAPIPIVVQKRRTQRIPLKTSIGFASRTQAYQHLFYIIVTIVTEGWVELLYFLKHSSDCWIVERQISLPLMRLNHSTQPQFAVASR